MRSILSCVLIVAMTATPVQAIPSAADRAMDAVYIATHVCGSYHRLCDGGHTVWGATKAVDRALQGASVWMKAGETAKALVRDFATVRGLPFVTVSERQLGKIVKATGISKSVVYDLLTVNPVKLLTGVLAGMAISYQWNTDDLDTLGATVSATAILSLAQPNSLGLLAAVIGVGRGLYLGLERDQLVMFVHGLMKGAAAMWIATRIVKVAGPALAKTVGLTFGGPWGAISGLGAAIITGIALDRIYEDLRERIPRWWKGQSLEQSRDFYEIGHPAFEFEMRPGSYVVTSPPVLKDTTVFNSGLVVHTTPTGGSTVYSVRIPIGVLDESSPRLWGVLGQMSNFEMEQGNLQGDSRVPSVADMIGMSKGLPTYRELVHRSAPRGAENSTLIRLD